MTYNVFGGTLNLAQSINHEQIYFRLSVGTFLRMSKSICRTNFDETSQSTTEILLLPVSENKRPLYWNFTSGFNFDLFVVIGISFCIDRRTKFHPDRIKFDSYVVTLIFRDGSNGVANLLPASSLVSALV